MLKVCDIMTRDVLSATPDQTLDSIRFAMSTDFVTGVPVCDAERRVIGVLSKSDLVEAHDRCWKTSRVGSLMSEKVYAVGENDPAHDALWLMATRGVHRVMVTDDDGVLVGIVTPMDIVKALVRDVRFAEVPRQATKLREVSG